MLLMGLLAVAMQTSSASANEPAFYTRESGPWSVRGALQLDPTLGPDAIGGASCVAKTNGMVVTIDRELKVQVDVFGEGKARSGRPLTYGSTEIRSVEVNKTKYQARFHSSRFRETLGPQKPQVLLPVHQGHPVVRLNDREPWLDISALGRDILNADKVAIEFQTDPDAVETRGRTTLSMPMARALLTECVTKLEEEVTPR